MIDASLSLHRGPGVQAAPAPLFFPMRWLEVGDLTSHRSVFLPRGGGVDCEPCEPIYVHPPFDFFSRHVST